MNNLKLSEWANVAEIAGTVVVIASLAYIGRQVSQNTQELQNASYQSMNAYHLELDTTQAANADLNRIIMLAESSPSEVSAEDWTRFMRMAYPRYGMWEYVFLSKQEGSADEAWLAFEPFYLNEFACKPGYLRFWAEHQSGFSEAFIEYMQSEVIPACAE